MVQPKRLDLRPLTPFLKPKPQPVLDDPAQQVTTHDMLCTQFYHK